MSARGGNDHVDVLDEFGCHAILKLDVPTSRPNARGVNSGVNIVTQLDRPLSFGMLNAPDVRQLSNAELAGYIKHICTDQYSPDVRKLFEVVADRLEHASE